MTSATFASLSVPAMEDSMEVSSSPAGNQFDGDIDIDFGDYGPGTHLTDDEHMLEDGEPTRPGTATDDMMDDDDHTNNAPIVEEVMQDSPDNEQQQDELADEELIDYDDDTFQDESQATFDDSTIPQAESILTADADVHTQTDHVGKANGESGDNAIVEYAGATLSKDAPRSADEHGADGTDAVEAQSHAEQNAESKADPTTETHDEVYSHDATNVVEDVTKDSEAVQVQTGGEEQGTEDASKQKAPLQLPGSLNIRLGHTSDGPPTPTDTGLHPIMLKFEGYELPLFKSRAQPEGLLKDDNLASLSLATLLRECRQQLAIKTSEPISDEQELCLGFDYLGLVLSEGSRSASGTSLNDVLEVYLQLHENDGAEDIPPLSLSLTRALKFDSSFAILKQAASQGKGMSAFSFLAPGHDEEFYQDDGDAEYADEDTLYHDAAGEQTTQDQDPAKGQESQEYKGQDRQDLHDSLGADTYEQGVEYHDGEYPEGQNGEYDENEEYPDPEDYDQEPTAPDEHEAQEYTADAEDATGEAPENAEEVVGLESAASSATARDDDPTNDATGEYAPEDLIDWDDDDLTTNSSPETYADVEAEDFSTLLTEYDADATQDDGEAPGLSEDIPDRSNLNKTDPDGDLNGADAQSAVDLGSEDLLQYEQPEEDAAHEDEEYFNEAGEDLDQYEENNYSQADNLVYDDQDEPQLGEDDEQFHTAYDLLDGDHAEDLQQNADTIEADQHTNGAEINEDDIGFDDDVDFGDHQSTAPKPASSNSPLGKRSYEDHIEDDGLDFGEPESKKVRSE